MVPVTACCGVGAFLLIGGIIMRSMGESGQADSQKIDVQGSFQERECEIVATKHSFKTKRTTRSEGGGGRDSSHRTLDYCEDKVVYDFKIVGQPAVYKERELQSNRGMVNAGLTLQGFMATEDLCKGAAGYNQDPLCE